MTEPNGFSYSEDKSDSIELWDSFDDGLDWFASNDSDFSNERTGTGASGDSNSSWTGEAFEEATRKLQDQWNKFEHLLYGDGPWEGLSQAAIDESELWKQFPHVRVVGKQICPPVESKVDEDHESVKSDDEDENTLVSEGTLGCVQNYSTDDDIEDWNEFDDEPNSLPFELEADNKFKLTSTTKRQLSRKLSSDKTLPQPEEPLQVQGKQAYLSKPGSALRKPLQRPKSFLYESKPRESTNTSVPMFNTKNDEPVGFKSLSPIPGHPSSAVSRQSVRIHSSMSHKQMIFEDDRPPLSSSKSRHNILPPIETLSLSSPSRKTTKIRSTSAVTNVGKLSSKSRPFTSRSKPQRLSPLGSRSELQISGFNSRKLSEGSEPSSQKSRVKTVRLQPIIPWR